MNIKKIVLSLVLLLLLVASFVIGRLGVDTPFNTVIDTATQQVESALQNETAKDSGGQNGTTAGSKSTDMAPYTGDTTNAPKVPSLPQGHIDMLKSFGIDPATVSVTPAMMACAEGKVGAARFAEIKNGATPSMLEGAKLVTCYK